VLPSPEKETSIPSLRDFDDGYVFVTVIFILAILTISAVAIATISQTESKIVRNERLYLTEFFNADSAIAVASETSTGEDGWGTKLNRKDKPNGYVYKTKLFGESGAETVIEAFRIEKSYTSVNSEASEFAAKKLPVQPHIDEPMLGSGTGVTGEAMIRRYAITAKPVDGNVQVQAGVYKYIPGGK